MSWNYAELSKLAKENGGPEALVENLIQSGIEQGLSEGKNAMVPLAVGGIGTGIALGAAAVVGIQKLIKKLSKHTDPADIEATKTELINGIKEYDENHPGESESKEGTENE